MTTIHQHDADVRGWWGRVPPELQLNLATLPTYPRVYLPKVLMINLAHYQCLCALHSSIVPLFSLGQDVPEQVMARQLSAQHAYESACAISSLLELVLRHSAEMSDFSSYIGYAAYCSYAVQIPFRWCLDDGVRATAEKNTAINLEVIKGIAENWKATEALVSSSTIIGT